jgi:hypothetical protein
MSGLDNAKNGMGWKHPNERAGCGNCKYVKVDPPINVTFKPVTWCGKGGFFTPRHAICDDWADAVGVRG